MAGALPVTMSPPPALPPALPTSTTACGLILFAHGARDPAWAAPFIAVAGQAAAARPGLVVRLAFLEFMSPGLAEAGAELAALGCGQVDVVPLFLGMGGHVRKDVPVLMAALQAHWPAVVWRLHPAAGAAPRVIDALAQTALEAVGLPGAEPAAAALPLAQA